MNVTAAVALLRVNGTGFGACVCGVHRWFGTSGRSRVIYCARKNGGGWKFWAWCADGIVNVSFCPKPSDGGTVTAYVYDYYPLAQLELTQPYG